MMKRSGKSSVICPGLTYCTLVEKIKAWPLLANEHPNVSFPHSCMPYFWIKAIPVRHIVMKIGA